MRRFLWSQVLHRRSRTLTLGAGILVAAVSFTMLTSAVSTSKLRVVGTVSGTFRPAYDILVRPSDSFSPLEQQKNLVQQNYLGGIFGGITFQQYRSIQAIPGVEVAAPIANIGYMMPFQFVPVRINRFLTQDPAQLYRLHFEWLANGGLSTYPDADQYVYYTRRGTFERAPGESGGVRQTLGRNSASLPVCSGFFDSHPTGSDSPFQLVAGEGLACFSDRTPGVQGGLTDYGPLPPGQVGAVSPAFFPVLIAAIDPAEEERLIGLDRAVVSGRMLTTADGPYRVRKAPGRFYKVVPFLASSRTYVDEELRVSVERLTVPQGVDVPRVMASDTKAYRFVTGLPETMVGSQNFDIADFYRKLIDELSPRDASKLQINYDAYWTAGPVAYQPQGLDQLTALATYNPADVFRSSYYGEGWAPLENRDVQFHGLVHHQASTAFSGGTLNEPAIQVVGRFDPELLPGFSPLSAVPLETYYPPQVYPADAAGRRALSGRPLSPTMNIGGYVAQPPLMLTTLAGLRAFTSSKGFAAPNEQAPISVIRIRVAGVTGPDPLSMERIRTVAQMIHERTGLAVDITAGSSPHPLLVSLPAGRFGQPPLLVREGWVQKGVAVAFLDALDRKSLALFVLILFVCGFFLANGAFASVRARRSEIGILLCLGWTERHVFRAVLGELAIIGLLAGIAGTVLAAALVKVLSLKVSLARSLLVAPIATVLALAAGCIPAWRASGAVPLDAIRPTVSGRAPGVPIGRIVGMSLTNLRRVPSRTLLGVLGLFVGVGTLTLLLAVTFAFQGALIGTLLGSFISIQVRAVDFASVLLVIALGGLSVTDVLFLNLRERAPELATLRATGWRESHLVLLVGTEGVVMGLLGAVGGAAVGVLVSALTGGMSARVVFVGALAAGIGVLVAVLASVAPASLIGRIAPPAVLAEE